MVRLLRSTKAMTTDMRLKEHYNMIQEEQDYRKEYNELS